MAWFADVYRKFEEDWQEGFRYMEDQVKIVGENVKKFCTEFVTEVLPESFLVDDLVSDPSEIQTSDGVDQISVKSSYRDPLEIQTCEERVFMEAKSNEQEVHMASLMHDKFEMTKKYSEEKKLNPASSSAVLDECSEHRFLRIKPPSHSASTRLTNAAVHAVDMTVDSAALVGLDCTEELDGSCILVNGFELAKLSTEARPRSLKKKVGSVLVIRTQSLKPGSSEPDSPTATIQFEDYSDWEFI